MAKSEELCKYVSVKMDVDVLPVVKAAAALDREDVQDWISDVLNEAASRRINQKPVKRKTPPSKKNL